MISLNEQAIVQASLFGGSFLKDIVLMKA